MFYPQGDRFIYTRRRGGSGPGLVYRRDAPELLIRDSAPSGTAAAGVGDALGGYAQITPGEAADRIIIGAFVGYQVGVQTAAGAGGSVVVQRLGRTRLATGAAGLEVPFGEVRWGGDVLAIVNAPGAATVVQSWELANVLLECAPKRVAAGTRIAAASAYRDAVFGGPVVRYYLQAFDPAAMPILRSWGDSAAYFAGTLAVGTVLTDYVTLNPGAGVWANGAYVTLPIKGAGVADANYLVIAASTESDPTAAIREKNIDWAIGGAGAEVIQARTAIPQVLVGGSFYSTTRHRLVVPFLLRAGERLAARFRQSVNSPADQLYVSMTMLQLA